MKSVRSVYMLTNSFAPLSPGGAERQAEHLSLYLSKKGIEVTVITKHAQSLKRFESKDGYNIIRIPQFGPGKMQAATFVLGAILTMLSRRKTFDILHAHLVFSPAFAAVIVGKMIGKKTIIRFRSSGIGSDIGKSEKSLLGRIRMAVLKRWADCFVVLTEEMEEELIAAGYDKRRIIRMYNGVDTDSFKPVIDRDSHKSTIVPQGKKLLLYTGRLVSVKNLPMLLNAMHKVVIECPELHLVLVGEGEESESLMALRDHLQLQSHVTFAGPASDVREYLQAADIFVMSSIVEGISNSLLEAMSCGLPCVSTDVGAAREILDDGRCGVLVKSNDVEEMAAAIVRLATHSDEAKKYGILARQRVLENYSLNTIGASYVRLYTNILNNDDLL